MIAHEAELDSKVEAKQDPSLFFSAVLPLRRFFCYLLFVSLGFSLGCSEFVIVGRSQIH